jgi:glyoxylase I family protein
MKPPVFSHIALNCRDQATTERFYTKHFGFRRARVIDLGAEQIIFLRSGTTYLELFRAKGNPPTTDPENDGPAWTGVRHLAFQVKDVEAALEAIGVDARVSLGPLGFDDFIPGWKTVWVRDPDGLIVEISQGFVDQANVPSAEADLAGV